MIGTTNSPDLLTTPQTRQGSGATAISGETTAQDCATNPLQAICDQQVTQSPYAGFEGVLPTGDARYDDIYPMLPGSGVDQMVYPSQVGAQPPGHLYPGEGRYLEQQPGDPRAGAGSVRQGVPTPEQPERLSPFQVYVKNSTGQTLPIFGQSLFKKVPSTFAPAEQVNITDEYTIGPGDELRIRIWGPVDLQARSVVDRSGNIYIARVGSVQVAGIRYRDLERHLRTAVGQTLRNFDLSATISRLRGIQIFVTGYASRPGAYTVSGLSTLVNAVFASGGPSSSGSMRRIQLKRKGRTVSEFDLYDLLLRGDTSKDALLQPEDVIYVPPVGPMAAVVGAVNVPGIYELSLNSTLRSEIEVAGGLASTADVARATIERIDDHKEHSVTQVPLDDEGFATSLKDGDIARVFSLSAKIENAVVLRGNVARPGRFPFKAGMRVSDLVPNREFLLTRDFWTGQMSITSKRSDAGQNDNPLGKSAPDINWDYAVIQRMDQKDLSSRLLSFNLSRAIERQADDDLELHAGDVITIFSQHDLAVPMERRTKYVRLEGEFKSAGFYRVQPGESLRDLVKRVGLTENAYLFGAELRRESTRVEQQRRLDQFAEELHNSIQRQAVMMQGWTAEDVAAANARTQAQREFANRVKATKATGRIGLALSPDASNIAELPDIQLEDGDVFAVGPRPTTVNVLGEVYNPTSFIFRSGQKIRDYVKRGGGTTRNADRSRTYVVRANGDVVSLRDHSSLWRGSAYDNVSVLPGDTIIVPLKLNRGETARAIREWTQIFSQLALGTVAIKVLTD